MTIEIDHIGLAVSDYEGAKAFYAAALAPLRMAKLMEWGPAETGNYWVAGFGADGKPFFWISNEGKTAPHTHVAFRAESRAQVDAFHAAALAAGGRDNGGPGVRELYHPNYYGAFVLDPEGHNIEAVCHVPPAPATAAKKKPARKAAKASARRATAKKPAKRAKPAAVKKAAVKKSPRKAAAKKAPARRGKKKR